MTDEAGKTAEKSINVTTMPRTVENILKKGNYVNYIDKNGATRLCMVLYDNSSGYGTQIITMDTVENIELGNGTGEEGYNNDQTYFNIAMESYNNAITTLNSRAEQGYLNPTYANDARSVGSIPNNKNSQSGYYTFTNFTSSYSGKLRDKDENYVTDYNAMEILGIKNIGEPYYLASRIVESLSFDSYSNFCLRVIDKGRMVSSNSLLYSKE